MTTGLMKEQNLEKQIEKQMGCMAGFFQLFDRHQILTGKRLYSAKRLPPSPVADTTSESEKSTPSSPAISRELGKPKQVYSIAATPSPEWPKSPITLPIFDLKQGTKSSWKFCKEAPRLSLDSRATTDAKGGLHPKEIRTTAAVNRCDSVVSDASDGSSQQQHQSPSVIARLMGLEPLPNSTLSDLEKKPELRRSASESRVSRDLFQSRFVTDNFYCKQQQQTAQSVFNNGVMENPDPRSYGYSHSLKSVGKGEPIGTTIPKAFNSTLQRKALPPQNRKGFFDSGDVFPEAKHNVSIYGEIEKRLRMRGIDEPSKDLETLKQILEALQLKGLLHTRKPCEQSHRNFVYDDSPIVLMKPSRLSTPPPINRRMRNDCSPSSGGNQIRRNYSLAGEHSPSVSPRRERMVRSPIRAGRSPSPPTRNEGNAGARRSNSLVKPKPLLSVETQRRMNGVSPVNSPKVNPRRNGPDPTVNNRSPRRKKATAEIYQKQKINVAEDESSSISGSSVITTSTDTERSKTEEYKDGRTLLQRCDKLLNSIAEMNASDMQPSPVSVLDSSFYKDESLTPSPVTTKRTIDFKDHSGELDDELWSPMISPIRSKFEEISDDCDFVYISEIMRASHYLPEDSDVFLVLEKQQYLKGKDTSKVSRLQRKLIFDTVNEILDRNKRLPPWKPGSWTDESTTKPSLEKVWSEFQKMQEHDSAEDLFETVCGVLKKDLAGDAVTGWGDCPVESSEAILDIERLIFKDLIGESIRDLAALASRVTTSSSLPRRKLVF